MGKDEREQEKAQKERNKRWKMAFTTRMSWPLGNVGASYKRDMLRDNCINDNVSPTDARRVE
jgi:hypothetical protein